MVGFDFSRVKHRYSQPDYGTGAGLLTSSPPSLPSSAPLLRNVNSIQHFCLRYNRLCTKPLFDIKESEHAQSCCMGEGIMLSDETSPRSLPHKYMIFIPTAANNYLNKTELLAIKNDIDQDVDATVTHEVVFSTESFVNGNEGFTDDYQDSKTIVSQIDLLQTETQNITDDIRSEHPSCLTDEIDDAIVSPLVASAFPVIMPPDSYITKGDMNKKMTLKNDMTLNLECVSDSSVTNDNERILKDKNEDDEPIESQIDLFQTESAADGSNNDTQTISSSYPFLLPRSVSKIHNISSSPETVSRIVTDDVHMSCEEKTYVEAIKDVDSQVLHPSNVLSITSSQNSSSIGIVDEKVNHQLEIIITPGANQVTSDQTRNEKCEEDFYKRNDAIALSTQIKVPESNHDIENAHLKCEHDFINQSVDELPSSQKSTEENSIVNFMNDDNGSCSRSNQESSGEDIPCTQCFQSITSEIVSLKNETNEKYDGFCDKNKSLDICEDEISFSPLALYNEMCYEIKPGTVFMSNANATIPSSSNIMTFSPLMTVHSTVSCKTLSVPKNEGHLADKSENDKLLESNVNNNDTEVIVNKISKADQDTINNSGQRNPDDFDDDDIQNMTSPSDCKISDNLSNSFDEVPNLAVFSPLSIDKIKSELACQVNEGDTSEIYSELLVPEKEEKLNFVTSQIVPEYDANKKNCVSKDFNSYEVENCHFIAAEHVTVIKPNKNRLNKEKQQLNLLIDSEVDEYDKKQPEVDFLRKMTDDLCKRKEVINLEKASDEQNYSTESKRWDIENETENNKVCENTREQVVPCDFLRTTENSVEELTVFYDENIVKEAKKTAMLGYHQSSFEWTSVYGSVLCKNNTTDSLQCTKDNLESITPLPSPLKRARPLRIGLSKRQKVRHLHKI